MDAELEEMCNQVVTWEAWASKDAHGNNTWNVAADLRTRRETNVTALGEGFINQSLKKPPGVIERYFITDGANTVSLKDRIDCGDGPLYVTLVEEYFDEDPTTPYYIAFSATQGAEP